MKTFARLGNLFENRLLVKVQVRKVESRAQFVMMIAIMLVSEICGICYRAKNKVQVLDDHGDITVAM